jgi:cell division protein FtsB
MKRAFGKFIFNGILLGLGIYLIYVLVSQQPVLDAKIKQKAELEEELTVARRLEIELKTDISMADSTYYIEKTAKEKLGMLKPNEKVFIDIRK